MMKLLEIILIIIVIVLLGMSLIALAVIHIELSEYHFSFTPLGINNYFAAYGNYRELLIGTVATTTALFGLFRLKAATQTNQDKVKQDRFSDWKTVLDVRFMQIEKEDPYMKIEFVRSRYKLFEKLYNLEFKITDKASLTNIFNDVFKGSIDHFENQNKKCLGMGGCYQSLNNSYAFDSFRYLLFGSADEVYSDGIKDLKELFIAQLPKDRTIDPAMYQIALQNYNPNLF